MKMLYITFEDEEYSVLKMRKDLSGKNWHDFILGDDVSTMADEGRSDRAIQCISCDRECTESRQYILGNAECPIRYKPR